MTCDNDANIIVTICERVYLKKYNTIEGNTCLTAKIEMSEITEIFGVIL